MCWNEQTAHLEDQDVFAVYLVEPDGGLYPVTWFEKEQEATNWKVDQEQLTHTPHQLLKKPYSQFIQEYRAS